VSQPLNQPSGPGKKQSPLVEATFVFRDVLHKPIEGLAVQIKAAAGTPPAPVWIADQDTDTPLTNAGAEPGGRSPRAAAPMPADSPAAAPRSPSANGAASNSVECTSDRDGKAITIHNAARNHPIDVLVKNRRGEYVWKATVTPKKDISAFTITSPEYHIEATTQLDGKGELEQDLDLPAVNEGEIMTIERLANVFGPYIGWTQKVTEQGEVRRNRPIKHKETTVDPATNNKTTSITIEHHYKVINTGRARTIAFNALGSRLNYPKKSDFTEDQYRHAAAELSVEVAAIKAIVMQESGGHGYMDNGLPPMRYERHIFHQLAARKLHTGNPFPAYPNLCFPHPGGYEDKLGPMHQYERLVRATKLDCELAFQACSWGGFQIMGSNYLSCGCHTVFEFVDRFMSGTDEQIDLFILFLKNADRQVIKGLRDHNWDSVAYYYNGPSWKTSNPNYATNLATFYEKFSK
jgi:hypothetical protein